MRNMFGLKGAPNRIRPCCIFTGTPDIAAIGWTKWCILRSAFPSRRWTFAGKEACPRIPHGVSGNTHHGHIIRGLDNEDPHRLLFRDIFLDTAQLASIVMNMPEVDADRVGATGWSQGGALTIACAALEPRIKKRRRLIRS